MSDITGDAAWSLEDVYDGEISPLMSQIIEICKRVDMPMIASFVYENDLDGQGFGYCTTQLGEFQPDGIKQAGMMVRCDGNPFSSMAITVTKDGIN